MPRSAAAKPGTERFRDERRKGGGPRMHSRGWHDHEEPRDLERVAQSAAVDAVPEVEAGGDRAGVGRQRKTSGTQGRERRKRTTPPSKGRKKSTRAAKGTGHGHRRANRD